MAPRSLHLPAPPALPGAFTPTDTWNLVLKYTIADIVLPIISS